MRGNHIAEGRPADKIATGIFWGCAICILLSATVLVLAGRLLSHGPKQSRLIVYNELSDPITVSVDSSTSSAIPPNASGEPFPPIPSAIGKVLVVHSARTRRTLGSIPLTGNHYRRVAGEVVLVVPVSESTIKP